ncbi:putative methyltransferase PMT15 [Zea mays]|uniref:Methyltransferase n=1 Tax=Zea mays TaxID=4577 RepID=A0A3L6GA43_MAIZE|nr:putative methyltransferase PMT15 [Zea mays]
MAVGATAAKLHLSSAAARRPSLLHFAAVAVLCSLSYLFGIWHHGGFSAGSAAGGATSSSVSIATAVSCASPALTTAPSSPPAGPLDFAAHHTAEGMESEAALRQRRYEACPAKYSEYTPCEDVERSLRFPRDRLVYRERHCPADGERLRCLVPAPRGYRNPFPWPASRDVAWPAQIRGQFQSEFGEQQSEISGMALASFAGVGSFQSLLRLSGQRVFVSVNGSHPEQKAIEAVARSLCWKKIKEAGDIAIWQKPTNHIHCKAIHKVSKSIPFCSNQNPDAAWYDKMEACITRLPEVSDLKEVAGGALKKWPERLTAVPPRIASGSIEGVTEEMFVEDTELWKKRVGHYKSVIAQLGQKGRYRNLLDMNAKFGGFAAALVNDPLWVMNMVPTVGNSTTLGAIYERGLIGSYQDWCEGMSTYPRTYDLIHADSLFTLYNGRCEADNILLEMDRILRPEGTVIIRDDVDMLVKIKSITDGMRWNSQIVDHEDGPLVREKLLLAVKTYWTLDDSKQ